MINLNDKNVKEHIVFVDRNILYLLQLEQKFVQLLLELKCISQL